jgi:hypothetical protein
MRWGVLIAATLLPISLQAQDSLPPFRVVFHPAVLRAFGWLYRSATAEIPVCLHGSMEPATDTSMATVFVSYATLPDAHPDSVLPRRVGGFGCFKRDLVGLAHPHIDKNPESLPWRCQLSLQDARNFALPYYRVLIVICDYGLIAVHWRTGHGVLCEYDPGTDPPQCRPYSGRFP